jgi:hypothetical protein
MLAYVGASASLHTGPQVVVEFKKSNRKASRIIELSHRPDVLPTQLYGRVDPRAWMVFMQEVDALAGYHPYTQPQSAAQCCGNLGGLACCEFLGSRGWLGWVDGVNPELQSLSDCAKQGHYANGVMFQGQLGGNRLCGAEMAALRPMLSSEELWVVLSLLSSRLMLHCLASASLPVLHHHSIEPSCLACISRPLVPCMSSLEMLAFE